MNKVLSLYIANKTSVNFGSAAVQALFLVQTVAKNQICFLLSNMLSFYLLDVKNIFFLLGSTVQI